MTERANANQGSSATGWTSTQAYVMAVVCLLVGAAGGYFLRGSPGAQPQQLAAPVATPPGGVPGMGGMIQPTPQQMKQMADTQAAPLLEKLKSAPDDAALLAEVGNIYYDTKQYNAAIDYYSKSLKIRPENANVRTDMGTAYYYLGDVDRALTEFNTALKYDPQHAQTMFNIGMVRWQGKMDATGAVEIWEKLLRTNPNYPEKERVQAMIAQAKQHINIKPATKTDKPLM